MDDRIVLLLRSPNLDATDNARSDLESGQVDERLVELLGALASRHELRVSVIKTGHLLGPRSPGGRENDHFFFRAADITGVDGVAVDADPQAPALIDVGRYLISLRGNARPLRVMGPAEWLAVLGEGDRSGFRDDPHATEIHADHLHIGF